MKFPILKNGKTEYIELSSLDEDMAIKNHGQTLSQLSGRGGLSPYEIYANINKLKMSAALSVSSYFIERLINEIKVEA